MSAAVHCRLCGRPAPRLDAGYCSARCRELAAAGYASPDLPPAALEPPDHLIEARLVAPSPAPRCGVADLGPVAGGSRLLRVRVDSEAELDAAVVALAADGQPARIVTLQRFSPRFGPVAARLGEAVR
ncbi:MAG: hypothetical protein JST08_06410 [Actinobacteria bacterium]|nr:hypothetical protein [Actinomycetota bacterium]